MTTRKRREPIGQTIGGVLFGFEEQVLRTTPPSQELVHHARPDDPVPAGDSSFVRFELPVDSEPGQEPGEGPGKGPDEAPRAVTGPKA